MRVDSYESAYTTGSGDLNNCPFTAYRSLCSFVCLNNYISDTIRARVIKLADNKLYYIKFILELATPPNRPCFSTLELFSLLIQLLAHFKS